MKFFWVLGLMLITATVTAQEPQGPESQGLMNQLRQLHEKARQSGADVPANLTDWAKRDLASAGNWEYKVLSVPAGDDAQLEQTLSPVESDRLVRHPGATGVARYRHRLAETRTRRSASRTLSHRQRRIQLAAESPASRFRADSHRPAASIRFRRAVMETAVRIQPSGRYTIFMPNGSADKRHPLVVREDAVFDAPQRAQPRSGVRFIRS